MRNKRETDISRYTDKNVETNNIEIKTDGGVKRFFKGFFKFLLTIFSVFFVAMIISGISLSIYIFTLASEPTGIDLKAKSVNQTSFIYIQDENGDYKKYQDLYSTENRIWVKNQDIPEAMKEAVVAIEDKRFFEHSGVDWKRTLSAVVSLATGTDTYGGSTITQQLIKNITDDNEVSINRKLREICKALKLEDEYTKDQILEAYLNVVNFGNNCQGVEAAAQLYFDKSIKDCSIAECAAIAGITQNPSLWNPLVYPEYNKERRELIINEMYNQEKITKAEYDQAMDESAKMTFVGYQSNSDSEEDEDDYYVQNWYIDELFYDLRDDLATYYNISKDAASDKLYTEGLKIYCAMDEKMQKYIEEQALKIDKSRDPDLQIGATLMDFDGRVIATVGSAEVKTVALEWNRATHSKLQPGSTIKPLFSYPIAIEQKKLYYSSKISNEQIENYRLNENGVLVPGPNNYDGVYGDNVLLPDAIERSTNCTAVQAMNLFGGPSVAYEQAITKMGFTHLSEQDSQNIGGLSIGGLNGGVTVREMAAAYNYMGNGGLYYEPYTYFYVTDSEGNVIIDNRNPVPKQAYSAETASIMNRLLHYNMTYCTHTNAANARVSGWDIIGKTGTTDSDYDSWYCGLSPYASLAVWTGYDLPGRVNNTSVATNYFSKIMGKYLEGKEKKEFTLSPNLIEASYNPYTGLITSTDYVTGKYVGYYTEDNMPSFGSPYYYDGSSSSSYSGNDYSWVPEETTPVASGDVNTDVTLPNEDTSLPPEEITPTEGGVSGEESSDAGNSESSGSGEISEPEPIV